ncbi:alpha/beta hydrolase [Solimonas sp. K1W22B-7]|uniref:alpha/beta hydrolase n=1 Tax=Solimonas sp. K1W22B-7 TaxID=2303331 RepID=UPI000E337398|nr:alpha/beta hydrolase [Solimonas sp. K1W22B-7]AXQ28309.1 alpha/beta hydrolase [Solimonas sp. K1W22B-7]
MTLDPQAQAMLQALSRLRPFDFATLTGEGYRAVMDRSGLFAPGDEVAEVKERDIPGPGGRLRLRIYRPSEAKKLPVTVFYHGGGFVGCTLDTHDNVCRCLAKRAETVVVSVDYRRAPEAPFPAAVEDALAALRWVHEHAADIGGDATRLAVAGDSAGGNLSAVVSQWVRDSGPKISHQLLIYPATDFAAETESRRSRSEGYFLTAGLMRWFGDQYTPDTSVRNDPRVSPLRATDFRGLPPATVLVAGYDPLYDEGLAYAARLREAGVAVEVLDYPGQIHGFINMLGAIGAADEALGRCAEGLRKSLQN